MAGVLNKSARQFNIKAMGKKGQRVVVRLVPGFNDVNDDHWAVCKEDDYVKSLKKDNLIDFGTSLDKALEKEEAAKAKSKADQMPPKKEGDGDADKDDDL